MDARAVLWTHCTHGSIFLGEVIHHWGRPGWSMDTTFPKGTAVISHTVSSPDCSSTGNDLLLLGMSCMVQISGTRVLTVSSELLKLSHYMSCPLVMGSLSKRACRQFNGSFSGAIKIAQGFLERPKAFVFFILQKSDGCCIHLVQECHTLCGPTLITRGDSHQKMF